VFICSYNPAGAADEPPIDRLIGKRIADFSLKNVLTDRTFRLYDLAGMKGVVLVFTGVDCPVGNKYMPRIVELARKYQSQGIKFVAINSNASESAESVLNHAREYGIDFPVLKDKKGFVARLCKAVRTNEVILLDQFAVIRYRGAIDDQFDYTTTRPEPEHRYLADALDALLAGKIRDLPIKATPVVGCVMDLPPFEAVAYESAERPRIRPAAPEIVAELKKLGRDDAVEVGSVNFAEHVAPLLHDKCANCHRPKQVGPFSLLTYDDARRWAPMIHQVVEERRMPPWHADPRHGPFSNDRSLTPRERAILMAWADQGTPLGDASKVPAPPHFAEEWTVGEPDVILQIPKPFTVPAEGVVDYQRFVVPTGFTEDKWVQSIECLPGDRSVVHHIIAYLLTKEMLEGKERRRPEHLGGYAPGDMPSVYEPGTAKRIPAGSSILFEIHYTPTGKEKVDQSRIGLIFATQPPTRRAVTIGIFQESFRIKAGESNAEVKQTWEAPRDLMLLAMMPHMHLRGKDFRYTVEFPDGKQQDILWVPAFDPAWQSYYTLANPLSLPKGTRIHCVAHFDNSKANPSNPDPEVDVTWGEQTWDEMMIGYIDVVYDLPAPGRIDPSDDDIASLRRRNAPVPQALRGLAERLTPSRNATARSSGSGNPPQSQTQPRGSDQP
jgi:peroxiredoxin